MGTNDDTKKISISSKNLSCQSCGMHLNDHIVARNKDGTPNEKYCKYCHSDGGTDEYLDIFCDAFGD